jgi:nucleolar GTP-binding protein
MAFAKITKLPTSQEIMRQCLNSARPKPMRRRPDDDALQAGRKFERERLLRFRDEVAGRVSKIVTQFPSVDNLNEFYRKLISTHISLDDYKRILGRVDNTKKIISTLAKTYKGRLEAAASIDELKQAVSAFLGRSASALGQLDESFEWLEEVRRMLEALPVVKEQFTVCIAGFPNVGKSTLFGKITGSAAEVNSYAFTTKHLNVGSAKFDHYKVQFIDTPGTLNRDHMNAIEAQADLALKYLADIIIYVYDPTEQYVQEKQDKLREHMDDFNAPVFEYVSKLDIANEEQISRFVTDTTINDISKIQEELLAAAKKYYTQSYLR